MKLVERTFSDAPAVREHVPLFVGLMGPSGSGKTYSALRLASGIQKVVGGELFGIDTESKRMLHYADQFKFRHVPFGEPFGSLDYLAAVKYCVERGAKTIVVDSMSHEHIGVGGYLQTQEAEVDRMAGDDQKKRERVKMAGWIVPSRQRQRMINGFIQLNGVNIIFCFRAKEKIKPRPGGEPIELGFMPIAGDELLFEMTLNCLLLPKANGVPTWRSDQVGERLMMKCPLQFERLFAQEKPLDEETGAAMAEWSRGGADAPTVTLAEATKDRRALLTADGDNAAEDGMNTLRVFWEGLTAAEKALVGGRAQLAAWKAAAEASTLKWDDESAADGEENAAA